MIYYRPLVSADPARSATALRLAGGWCWFDRVEVLERGRAPEVVAAAEVPGEVLARLTAPRADFAGLAMARPQVMAILNTTPDSFSDGGRFLAPEAALAHARALASHADLLDIGGESTRPGALEVAVAEEIARTAPVIAALRAGGLGLPISIDTRKAAVAEAALQAGAYIVNDVTALTFDAGMGAVVAGAQAPVILMHSVATPATMQHDPRYGDVLLEVYDALEASVAQAVAAGIAPSRIMVDPGIGFGKTVAHNLALLARLSLFHSLGCPILLGASRKRFIGAIAAEADPDRRLPGSVAVALAGVAQGVQMLRVHDARETRQAIALWRAATEGTPA